MSEFFNNLISAINHCGINAYDGKQYEPESVELEIFVSEQLFDIFANRTDVYGLYSQLINDFMTFLQFRRVESYRPDYYRNTDEVYSVMYQLLEKSLL